MLNYQYGSVLGTNEYLRGEYEGGVAVDNYQAISLSFGWNARGDKIWHHLYGNPAWGFGLYHADFSRPDDLGAPYAFYGFYTGPFKSWKRFSIDYNIQIGFSFNWIPFHEEENMYQISLGDDKAVYVNLGVRFRYQLSKHFDIDAGFAFSHFSNGSTVKPNKGINLAAPQLGLHYHIKGDRPKMYPIEIPEHKDNWEWTAGFTFGMKQIAFDTTHAPKEIDRRYVWGNYNVLGFSTVFYRQFSYKSKVGAGLDFLYDESFTAEFDDTSNEVVENNSSFASKVAIGIYGSYELTANNLSFYIHPGLYVLRKERGNEIPAFYQRVGIKYHVLSHLYLGVSIKAYNFHVADFIEWNLGYRLRWY